MSVALWNLLLALAWVALTGHFTPSNLFIGFAIGYLVMALVRAAIGSPSYFRKAPQAIAFLFFYLWQLVLSNLRVAYHVLTPKHTMRAGVIAIPLDAQTDMEITVLANLITLTPGTLSLDVSADRRVLYVHVIHIDDDVDSFRMKLKRSLERRVLELLR